MAVKVKHGTLVANVVTTVDIDNAGGEIEIVNRTLTGAIYVRFGPSAATVAAPTVAGDDCYVVVGARRFDLRHAAILETDTLRVKLISSAALDYSIEGGAL